MLRAYDHMIKFAMNCVVVHHFQKTPPVCFGVSFVFAAPLDSKKCALKQLVLKHLPKNSLASFTSL